ncbi:MAG: aminotransferase class V-fold PLP-dependent enzyme [Ignavibacteria bacterium]|nr:aminotransferase class V-fold PLP-dependent enzyme [Ignavibacteria bacterium]
MEKHFEKFRNNIIGQNCEYLTPYGKVKLLYADWIATGRLYRPIEERIINELGPFVANTHTETSETGTLMTKAYQKAQRIIKEHFNAGKKDVIINAGFGMTTVVNKLQRMLGLKPFDKSLYKNIPEEERPVVFITHMEHHSNHTTWYETIADVVQIEHDSELLVNLDDLESKLEKYKHRKNIYGSFTAASNVTGIETPYREMAKLIHHYGGYCFVDFAMAAPYVDINMHTDDESGSLDAVFFSPHKFLGGPGSSGVMIFNSDLYKNISPDQPGGGTVYWTNPWGEYRYYDDIELREDGGTPGFLQAIKAALCLELKNEMGTENMRKREDQLLKIAFEEMRKITGMHILADNVLHRLGAVSFYIDNIHYNLIVRLLSDRFGVQVRGGCACAGTYGHYLLNVSYELSHTITSKIDQGDLTLKPGWVRLSLHPTMLDDDLYFIIDALKQITAKHYDWEKDYTYDKHTNEFYNTKSVMKNAVDFNNWFRKL